uniref:Uncharacterized protein n=1 Tax=Moniliophthora roreri TaxID=221103 RepID=A0A0W0FN44_MONRR
MQSFLPQEAPREQLPASLAETEEGDYVLFQNLQGESAELHGTSEYEAIHSLTQQVLHLWESGPDSVDSDDEEQEIPSAGAPQWLPCNTNDEEDEFAGLAPKCTRTGNTESSTEWFPWDD